MKNGYMEVLLDSELHLVEKGEITFGSNWTVNADHGMI